MSQALEYFLNTQTIPFNSPLNDVLLDKSIMSLDGTTSHH